MIEIVRVDGILKLNKEYSSISELVEDVKSKLNISAIHYNDFQIEFVYQGVEVGCVIKVWYKEH